MSSSIREIAARTGLSIAAVSQAMRGVGRLAPRTRERILAVAEELGYRPDPLLSHAFSRVRQPREKRYRETLGFIVEWPTEEGPDYQKLVHRAALEQATQAGYKLESFAVSGKASEQRRLSQILRARGIRGLIIIPRLGNARPRLHFEWDAFSAISIGRTLWQPRNLHRVETGDYQQVLEALHLLKKVGYRRLGMAVEEVHNTQQLGVYYAAFLHNQIRVPASRRVPIFAPTSAFEEAAFKAWLETHRPDVIIINKVKTVSEWLRRLGLSVPGDLSIFSINAQEPQWSGVRRDYPSLGRSAVDMVTLLLRNGERGLPGNPRSLQVEGFWQEGSSLARPITDYLTPQGHLRLNAAGAHIPALD